MEELTSSQALIMLVERVGLEFDGECHLAEDEAFKIARLIERRDAAIERLEAEIVKLRAIMMPFALAAGDLDDKHGDHAEIWEASAAMAITAGHLRKARAALTPDSHTK